jgi:hypothetical protein
MWEMGNPSPGMGSRYRHLGEPVTVDDVAKAHLAT